MPSDPAITSVLSPIEGLYTEVNTLEAEALVFRPDLPQDMNTLHTLNPYHGYWIRMEADATLSVAGERAAETTPLQLQEGWNLISYLPASAMTVESALQAIDGLYDEVRGFHGEGLSYFPSFPSYMNTLTTMEPGYGYMVHMAQAAVLAYPSSAG